MTEPSEAALKRADELIRKMSDEIWHERYIGVLMADCSPTLDVRAEGATKAFARYIENTSDVAKKADRGFDKCGYGDAPGSLRHKIKSLILDDEPCKHTVSYIWIGGGLVSDYCGIRCSKCGTRLKIVEVGDD